MVVKKFAQLPLLMIGYHVPETNNPDYYALQVLQTVLFAGESSRMYRRVVDKDQLALSVESDYQLSFDPTLFVITAQPKENIAPAAVEKEVYEELERVKTNLITDDELGKAKNILLANFYRNLKTINGKASALGSYEVFFGGYHRLFTAADEFNKVTKEDVQRVAQKYFSDKNRTVATLIPDPTDQKGGGSDH